MRAAQMAASLLMVLLAVVGAGRLFELLTGWHPGWCALAGTAAVLLASQLWR